MVDVEFEKTGTRLKVAEVGEEVTKTKSAVRIAGIERGKDDVGHGGRIKRFAEWIERTIDIGAPSRAFPVTPPRVRVRTRRFGCLPLGICVVPR